jgi:SAM-dependent methyltransferase
MTNQPDLANSTGPSHSEFDFYRFGLKVGFANYRHNKFRLGGKKTLGKILQPINSYTRFPEYEFFGRHVEERVLSHRGSRLTLLDVSSPKLFGLWLAYYFDIEAVLTDIDEPTLEEAQRLWEAIKQNARGIARFQLADARSLAFEGSSFDIAFAMSVIEHVAGEGGDSKAIEELLRVTKPGGLVLVSTPIGPKYVEQVREGFEGAAKWTGNDALHFFQRIYDLQNVSTRLVPGDHRRILESATVSRRDSALARFYRSLGSNPQALLGFLNPLLSRRINHVVPGLQACPGSYDSVHSGKDVYGDVLLAWQKE